MRRRVAARAGRRVRGRCDIGGRTGAPGGGGDVGNDDDGGDDDDEPCVLFARAVGDIFVYYALFDEESRTTVTPQLWFSLKHYTYILSLKLQVCIVNILYLAQLNAKIINLKSPC